MKSWKKVIAASLLALVIGGIAQAKTTESVPVGKGYDPYPGFIIADMSMENGVVSNDAAYSMRYFHNFGLIPVAYCSSVGSHFGTYYTFYVNPYNNCMIGGKMGLCPHLRIFESVQKPFAYTGSTIYSSDISTYAELHRRIIAIAKIEFEKYQQLVN